MGITLTSGIKEGAPKYAWRNVERLLNGGKEVFQIHREAKNEGEHEGMEAEKVRHIQGIPSPAGE